MVGRLEGCVASRSDRLPLRVLVQAEVLMMRSSDMGRGNTKLRSTSEMEPPVHSKPGCPDRISSARATEASLTTLLVK